MGGDQDNRILLAVDFQNASSQNPTSGKKLAGGPDLESDSSHI